MIQPMVLETSVRLCIAKLAVEGNGTLVLEARILRDDDLQHNEKKMNQEDRKECR